MAAPLTTRRAINVAGDTLALVTGGAGVGLLTGTARIGFGISGSWTGLLTFQASNDGLNFFNTSVAAFPLTAGFGTVQTASANGNFEASVKNLQAFRIVATTLTSGTVSIVMSAANDSSYQDAFIAATSRYVSQSVAAGAANVVTIAAQANRSWRVRTCVVCFNSAPANPVEITFQDGGSATLWDVFVPVGATGLIGSFPVPLPADPGIPGITGGGVCGSPGNSMVVTLAAPGGSVVSKVNLECVPE